MKVVFGAMVVRGFVVCRLIDVVTSDGSSLANSLPSSQRMMPTSSPLLLAWKIMYASWPLMWSGRLDESALLAIGDEGSFAHP